MSLIIPNTFAIRTGTVQLELLDDNFSYISDNVTLLKLSQDEPSISGAGGVLDTILPSGEVSGYVLTTTGAGSYQWAAAPGGITTVGTKIDTTRQSYTATSGQTIFALTGGLTYTPGSGQLRVYIDGIRQFPAAYTETSTTVFTLTTGAPAGTKVLAEIDGFVSYPIAATDISYSPAGGSTLSSTNVQTAISELESEKITYVTPGTSGNLLTSDGTSWISSSPIGVGIGQTWQNVTASRAMGTTYTNSTGKPIMLIARAQRSGVSTSGIGVTINGVGVIPICYGTNSNGGNEAVGSIIIPIGATYVLSVTSEALSSFTIWELR
jgi:hypothetical protein